MLYGQVAAITNALSSFTQPFLCGAFGAPFASASVTTTIPLKIYSKGISCHRMEHGRPGIHRGTDAKFVS